MNNRRLPHDTDDVETIDFWDLSKLQREGLAHGLYQETVVRAGLMAGENKPEKNLNGIRILTNKNPILFRTEDGAPDLEAKTDDRAIRTNIGPEHIIFALEEMMPYLSKSELDHPACIFMDAGDNILFWFVETIPKQAWGLCYNSMYHSLCEMGHPPQWGVFILDTLRRRVDTEKYPQAKEEMRGVLEGYSDMTDAQRAVAMAKYSEVHKKYGGTVEDAIMVRIAAMNEGEKVLKHLSMTYTKKPEFKWTSSNDESDAEMTHDNLFNLMEF